MPHNRDIHAEVPYSLEDAGKDARSPKPLRQEPLSWRNALRKLRSLYHISKAKCRSMSFRLHCLLSGRNIKFGKNVAIGRSVHVETTGNGFIEIGDNVFIDDYVHLYNRGGSIFIGSDSYVGVGSQIAAMHSIEIDSSCLIAAYCVIRDSEHGIDRHQLIRLQQTVCSPVHIGSDVWLGSHVVVTAGVTIGDGAVIGANAVVTKDITDYTIAVGVPARPLKAR